MPKSDFISDKLIDISDRFKRDYAERNHLPLPEDLESGGEKVRSSRNVQRDVRELAERITRDRALAARQLEELELRRGELQRFDEAAQKVLERTGAVDSQEEAARLRIEYFGAAGRISFTTPSVMQSAASEDVPLSVREIFRRTFPLAAAIVFSALIVAGTLVALLA